MNKTKKKKSDEDLDDEKNDSTNIEIERDEKNISTEEVESIESSERIAELEEKNTELNDRLLRRSAEFENFKRRTENDQLNLLKYAAESFILKILPVYDDLNRSLDHIDDDNNKDSLREGLKMVADKFSKVLDEQGVKRIEVKGKEFDHDYHEALLRQPSDDVPANTVLEEVEAGYMYKDKVLKHAKVIVSQGNDETNEQKEEE